MTIRTNLKTLRENGKMLGPSLSPIKCFLTNRRKKMILIATLNLLSANAFNLDQSEILSFSKELTICHRPTNLYYN